MRSWYEADTLLELPWSVTITAHRSAAYPSVYADTWEAAVPELPGCHAYGDTRVEALSALTDVVRDHLQDMIQREVEIPEPRRVEVP